MAYLAIRRDAAEELIAERAAQSTDFELGQSLATSLKKGTIRDIMPRVGGIKARSGEIVFGRRSTEQHYLVFDLDQSELFYAATDYQRVLYLQKTLRFAVKFWDRSVMTPAEKVVSASTSAVFPFPLSQKTGVRITIGLNPDVERLSKRGKSGKFLLVYKIGTDEGEGPKESPNLANFRKFLEELDSHAGQKLEASSTAEPSAWADSFSATSLGPLPSKIDIHQGYETWMRILSEDQRRFALASVVHPTRIDGPAGTGKTASLSIAAVHSMRRAKEEDAELQGLFITHSEASRRSIETILRAMGGSEFFSEQAAIRRLRVETLQGFCAQMLRQDLSETEFVDSDAHDAKQLQMMYVDEALHQLRDEYETYSKFISDELRAYMDNEQDELKAALIQHEIAVVIKGRARESLDTYKKISSLANGLPVRNEADKAFIWRIYERYRERLITGGQFDTDDVVLSALSQLSTPIWRRRRTRDGFDVIFVDETHLFNMNELSIFHHLTKLENSFPIAFAVDRTQAIGDRGWTDDIDVTSLMPCEEDRSTSKVVSVNGIFRCSPDIVNLAFSVTSSGASLFTNFQDPMKLAHSNMTFEEEKKSKLPLYLDYPTDSAMLDGAFETAESMRASMDSSRGDIAIVPFDEDLFHELEKRTAEQNKPYEILKNRGDYEVVRRARSSGRYVLSLPDYVGGLEFDGVILVGVDEGRVPPSPDHQNSQSKAYVTFASHNKLYVAITRARYQVVVLGVRARGPSPILRSALDAEAIVRMV